MKFFKSEDKYIVLGIKCNTAYDELPFKGYQLLVGPKAVGYC